MNVPINVLMIHVYNYKLLYKYSSLFIIPTQPRLENKFVK